MTAVDVRLWLGAVACSAVAVFLGYRVTHGPPILLDQFAPWIFGRATATATVFTVSGYGPFVTGAAVAALGIALALRTGLAGVLTVVVAQCTSQAAITVLKPVFHRYRPDEWLFRHELGFSFPSGHATTAAAFYGGFLALVATSALPLGPKLLLCALLGAWALGICWSRVALGAHYPSDVVGGVLFGVAFLCAAFAVAARLRAH